MFSSKKPRVRAAPRPRGAFTSVEALASLAVMAIVLAFVGQWSSAMIRQRRSITLRQVALQATDNVVALAMAAEFTDVTTEHLLALARPYTPPGAAWEIDVQSTPIAATPTERQPKRIVVGLTYKKNAHYDAQPLVVWKYPTRKRANSDD